MKTEKPTQQEIDKAMSDYCNSIDSLEQLIERMPKAHAYCECKSNTDGAYPETVSFVEIGSHMDEISSVCLTCGGDRG